MKKTIGLFISGLLAFLLSCENKNTEPNYSIIPHIMLKDFKYLPGDISKAKPDTFKLSFNLQDGDFDLGLRTTDTLPPFNQIFLYNKMLKELVPFNDIPKDLSDLITFSDRKILDTLPPLNCSNWLLAYTYQPGLPPQVSDTVYYHINPNSQNIFINIFTKDDSQVWSYFDINNVNVFPDCSPYFPDGIFPEVLFTYHRIWPFEYKALSSKEGVITYNISSFRLHELFYNKTIKIEFSIQDRALHRSNVVETNEVLIQ